MLEDKIVEELLVLGVPAAHSTVSGLGSRNCNLLKEAPEHTTLIIGFSDGNTSFKLLE